MWGSTVIELLIREGNKRRKKSFRTTSISLDALMGSNELKAEVR